MLTAAFCAMYNNAAENWNNLQRHIKSSKDSISLETMRNVSETVLVDIKSFAEHHLTGDDLKQLKIEKFDDLLTKDGELQIILHAAGEGHGAVLTRQGPSDPP